MWFRRKNKPDSDHSVLSTTLVSLQGLLDEPPVPGKPHSGRQEPKLPATTPDTQRAVSRGTNDNELAAGQVADSDAPVQAAKSKSGDSGSSWANLDLDFDEAESTAILPAIDDSTPAPVAEPMLEPDEEIEAAPAPDAEIDAEVAAEEDDAEVESEDESTTTTLFDVIPTLSDVVFDPETKSATGQAAAADQAASAAETAPVTEPASEQRPASPDAASVAAAEADSEPPVIVPGVSITQPPPAPVTTTDAEPGEAQTLPLAVPLAPREFTEYLIERLDNAYHEHLHGEMPAPLRDAAHHMLLESIQQWIAQARQVLQRK